MVTLHLPRKFYANRSSRFLAILLIKKQREKETNKDAYKQTNKQTKTKEIDQKRYPVLQ